MNVKQITKASNSIQSASKPGILKQMLALISLAVGLGTVAYTAPAQAIALTNSDVTFSSSAVPTFFNDVNPGADDTITVNFTSPLDVGSANGLLEGSTFFPNPGRYDLLTPIPTATFNYVSGDNDDFRYQLASSIDFKFANGVTVEIGGGTRFKGDKSSTGTSFSTIDPTFSSFKNGTTPSDVVSLNALSFGFNDITSRGNGGFVLTASTVPASTSVPEPFTIIGTILGGTAAIRMRKKLAAAQN